MRIYRGQVVPLNVAKTEHTLEEPKFRPFTLRQMLKTANPDKSKAPGPRYTDTWALKTLKNAIGTDHQIIFNE